MPHAKVAAHEAQIASPQSRGERSPKLAIRVAIRAIQSATMDSLESALPRGAISDRECLSLMQTQGP